MTAMINNERQLLKRKAALPVRERQHASGARYAQQDVETTVRSAVTLG